MQNKVICFFVVVVLAAGMGSADEQNSEGDSVEAKVNAIFTRIRVVHSIERNELIQELFEIGETGEESVIEYLSDNDKTVIITAIRLLAHIRSETGKKKIMSLTIHPNWEIRAWAVIGLGNFSDDDVVKRLSDSLFLEKNIKVREAAAYSLCLIDNPKIIRVLLEAVMQFKGKIRNTCMQALQRGLTSQHFAVPVADMLKGKGLLISNDLRMILLEHVGNAADRRTIPFFAEQFKSPDVHIRALCAIGLGRIGDTRAVDILRLHVDDKASLVREKVKESLFRITNFNQWENTEIAEKWLKYNGFIIQEAAMYEEIIEESLSKDPAEWDVLLTEIEAINKERDNADVFCNIIIRCLLSKSRRTNDFVVYCFKEFQDSLNPGLQYLLNFGSTSALATEPELFRACELASIISYRYGIKGNIPDIIKFLENVENLNENVVLSLRRPISYLCLRGLTAANIPDRTAVWAKWWRKNSKK